MEKKETRRKRRTWEVRVQGKRRGRKGEEVERKKRQGTAEQNRLASRVRQGEGGERRWREKRDKKEKKNKGG